MAERDQNALQRAEVSALTPERLLGGIHYLRVHDATEQLATVRSLATFVEERPAIRWEHMRHGCSARGNQRGCPLGGNMPPPPTNQLTLPCSRSSGGGGRYILCALAGSGLRHASLRAGTGW